MAIKNLFRTFLDLIARRKSQPSPDQPVPRHRILTTEELAEEQFWQDLDFAEASTKSAGISTNWEEDPGLAKAADLAFEGFDDWQYVDGEYRWQYGTSSWIEYIRWNPRLEQMWVKVQENPKVYGPTPCSQFQFNDLVARASKGKGVNAIWKTFRAAGYLGIVKSPI